MNLLSAYWRHEMAKVNLGDYLTELILNFMGHDFVPYGSGGEFDNNGCLLGVGSLLGSWAWLENIKGPVDVWGTGARGSALDCSRFTFHAVRGPLTVKLLNLPEDTPLGDPALLLPKWILKGFPMEETLYIPHWASADAATNLELEQTGADELLDMMCARKDVKDIIRRISSAGFVLTGSLHGAIIAQAYGVPWAFCFPRGRKVVMPFRLEDWCAYLGIKAELVTNLEEGKLWWERHGSKGQLRDLQPLLDSFPY